MIMFEKGFKADTVAVWMNDSLLYSARITTTPNTGSAGSMTYRLEKLNAPTIKLMVNGTCYVVPMRYGACYLYVSRKLGRIRLIASHQFQGFYW